ncbi:M48 family metallopeptidase [Flavobacterium amnicola]|uniref:M48 family metallopeptidase n=1 Tax=Flavobacterium amnicola TaxID=2506422 RepID=A0A4Q1K5V5_9FLAO|nr:M48 family metallopeptidase [Flavobacterium amnicola]RXR21017.1 M48 family metallopeptidase [Flavobacterium amnicola]
MLFKTTARFYDGKTSVPQNIEVFLDIKQDKLSFENGQQKIVWKNTAIKFSKNNNNLICEHGNDPIQQIFISDADFIKKTYPILKSKGHQHWYDGLVNLGFMNHLLIAISLLALIGLSYVYVLPWVAEKAVTIIPESYDNEIGQLAFNEEMLLNKIDSSKTKTLNQFASELKLNNKKKLKFTVVNSDIVNAYALPDGNIVVFTGILNALQSTEELAGLLGHESSHVNNRHSMKMLCRNLSGYLFISAILGDANGVMAIIGDNVNSLNNLSFSRKFETEADNDGYTVLIKNNLNPEGMTKLFTRLKEEETIDIPEFLSSHPVTDERIKEIQKRIKSGKHNTIDNQKLTFLFQKIKE